MTEPQIHVLRDHQDMQRAWDALGSFSGDLAFNVGANLGQAAKVLAGNFTRVISYEPCQESYRILADESPPNVTSILAALSDHEGHVVLTESAYSITTGQLTTGSGLAWGDKVGERRVVCSTVDAEVELYGPPDLIQVDTEGHEVLVIQGALRTIEAHHPALLIEIHRKEHEGQIRTLCDGYSWQVLHYEDRRDAMTNWDHFWGIGTWAE